MKLKKWYLQKNSIRMSAFLLSACVHGMALADVVSVDDAKLLADEFYCSGLKQQSSGESLLKLVKTGGSSSSPSYYVFNASDGHGFVIISADDSTQPVLGYSFENSFLPESVPTAMTWVMDGIANEIKHASRTQTPLSASERRKMARAAVPMAQGEVVLATPEWSQEAPFNSMVPGRPLTGCVGTAMAAIMKYHSFPVRGTGSFDGVSFDVEYDWANMRTDNYRKGYSQAEADAVATLVWHAAKSIDTKFGMSGSSAYEVRVPAALSNYFGYDPGVSYKKRSDVSTQQAWDNIVINEIKAGRPVLYCGQDVTVGHAFICDGYNDRGYMHFNWGWGGAANGFFLTTALNPTVSTTHSFNNLNTIIYNIKPGNGNNSVWSPIHITADGGQVGMGSDMTELSAGKVFKVRVGNLKNLSYSNFSGKLAVALFGADGRFKTLLSKESNLNLGAMAVLPSAFSDFANCSLPAGVAVAEGDMIRMATSSDGGNTWSPVAGELLTVNEISAVRSIPDYFTISFPQNESGVSIEGDDKVIRGWDYTFKVTPSNPSEDVVTVRSNGYILTSGDNWQYTVSNVKENQIVDILVQKASEVVAKRSFWVGAPGELSVVIPDSETGTITDLTLFGTIDERDFEFIRTKMKLTRLDISSVSIAAYGSNQANAIPKQAFSGLSSLKEVILPKSVNRLNNGCFRQCGITSIVIPAGVKTYEYNVFNAARSLRDIWVGRETAEFINWCVLSGVKVASATLHVPSEKALSNYKAAENWNTIANIVVDPAPAVNDYAFAVMDSKEVNYNSDLLPGRVEKGTVVKFTAEHIADNDNRMDVYANNTLLKPSADGTYTTTINGNTIIHFDLVKPIEKGVHPSFWQLTNTGGTIGLLTDAVNVIPGKEFVIRANALKVPAEWNSMFWAAALTDKDYNIKEFISPISVWSGASGDNLKMNITCCVKESTVREGNMICLFTSTNKKTWSLVEGSSEDVVAAIPALNNVTPVYNINFPTLENATVTGVVATAVRGRDITIKIVPKTVSDRINMLVNGVPVAKEAPSVTYSFIAKEDMNFDVEVYSPKIIDEVVYNVNPGELFKAVTAASIKPRVKVVGSVYSNDLSQAFQQDFVQKNVTHVDLSEVSIVAGNGGAANTIPAEMFYKISSTSQLTPKVQEVILPKDVIRIESGAFKNCANIKEMELPENLATWDGSGNEYGGLKTNCFEGCTSLMTLYVPCPSKNGKVHQFDYKGQYKNNLGIENASNVTVVVKPEYLEDYLREDGEKDDFGLLFNGGNGWKINGFNIVAEYPVYSVNFDATRFNITDKDFDTDKAASFLGDNVANESLTINDKILVNKPAGAKVKVYDNGSLVSSVASNGAVPVTFYNPNKHSDKSGNHELAAKYLYDVTFVCSSNMFVVEVPEVRNNENTMGDKATEFEIFNYYNALKPVLENVAENSVVRFALKMNTSHTGDIEPRVKVNGQVISRDDQGFYNVDVTDGNVRVDIFAVPVNGATLGQEELNSIDLKEAVDITSIALEGNVSIETLSKVLDAFVSLETLDLTGYTGEISAGVFSAKENLKSVALPAVSSIEAETFKGCRNLATVTIPETVKSIGDRAFKDCGSLSSITVTGIETIGADAFDGCGNMTSIFMNAPASSKAKSGIATASLRTRSAGISTEAFNGLNPNCIITLDAGVAVPDAKGNYLVTTIGKVTEEMPDGSFVEREGRIYTSVANIQFDNSYPLNIPNSFNIGDLCSVDVKFAPSAYAAEGNWSATVLPFEADMADYPCTAAVVGNEGEFSVANIIPANTPFIVRLNEGETEQELNFMAVGAKVPATPADINVNGGEFSLAATYKAIEIPCENTYLMNDSGTGFERCQSVNYLAADDDSSSTVALKPFEVYALSAAGMPVIDIKLDNQLPTGVTDIPSVDGEFTVGSENGILIINSSEVGEVTVYGIDGKAAGKHRLQKGRNEISGLGRGVYIVAGVKVII